MARREFQDPSLLVLSAQGAEWYFRYRVKVLDVGKGGKPSIQRVEKWRSLGLCSVATQAAAKREKAKILAHVNNQVYEVQSLIPWPGFVEIFDKHHISNLPKARQAN